MSSFWWLDASHKQQGPVDATQAIGLVKTGQIRADTQVWTEGMAAWAAAKDAPVLGEQFRAAAPPPPPVTGQPAVRAPGAAQPPFATSDLGSPATGGGQLQTTITVWGLFWRSIVVVIGDLLVIPSPWTSTMFRRYVATTTQGPDGRAFEFAGQPGDIWWVFVLIGLCELAAQTDHGRIASLISIGLGFLVLRWFIGKLRPCGQTLEFTGGFWPYIGFVFLSSFRCSPSSAGPGSAKPSSTGSAATSPAPCVSNSAGRQWKSFGAGSQRLSAACSCCRSPGWSPGSIAGACRRFT